MLIYIVNSVLIAIAVMIHYEALRYLSTTVSQLSIKPRLRVVVGVFGTLCAHIAEI